MAENSSIEWTDHTFNPWRGCTKVSPGCEHCYAAALSKRVGGPEYKKGAPRLRTTAENWRKPLKWNQTVIDRAGKPHHIELSSEGDRRPRVFCASLADWLDDEVPIHWLADLLTLIYQTPNLDWLLLTKRPGNWLARMRSAFDFIHDRDARGWLESWMAAAVTGPMAGQAPDNIWVGATAEDQKRADERIPKLIDIPAKVRFLSCEPLLGELDLMAYLDPIDGGYVGRSFIDWIIAGGESGGGARPMHPDWPRSLRNQCEDSGVPFHFKQWGEWVPVHEDSAPEKFSGTVKSIRHDGEIFDADAEVGFCCSHCSIVDVLRIGKKAAGRLLDGVEHNAFPSVLQGAQIS